MCSFSDSFIHLFVQQLFIKHQLYVRYKVRYWRENDEGTSSLDDFVALPHSELRLQSEGMQASRGLEAAGSV